MTSTTETATPAVDQSNNQTAGTQEPVSPVSEQTAEAQTDATTNESKAETASPKKEAVPKPTVHKTDYEKDTVYLYQFTRFATIPSSSPFCLKVETFLRMAGIAYENVDHQLKFRSKKGQLPFVELNGKEIADSDIIIQDLTKIFEKDLDEGLTEEQKNNSHAYQSMLDNHTSWVVRYWRYNNPQQFIDASKMDMKRITLSKLPNSVLNVLLKIGFKQNVKQVLGHGIGHNTEAEIYDFGKSDLKALSKLLDDKDYFFGKDPHLLDCVAFAHLAQFVFIPFGEMTEWMETETANLVAFVNRIKDKYWTDWEEICTTLELNTHLPKKELSPEKEEELKKEEQKKEEEKKKKEEKKRLQEEKKKEREEKKKKDKEEKDRLKKEKEEKARAEKEQKEKEKKEKEEKEKAEKEAKEKADKEKAEAEKSAAEAAAATAAAAETKTEEKPTESTPETKETAAEEAPKAEESSDKKE
ncbi:failed axon connections-like [Oppia nitens]|uniref:failed axon connections-like n=1 Tax=Oppia nitens TaxID=1686743 RepID=UPI0023DC0A03|nr:failed axon connections-like [Oppia nitens]